MNNRILLKIFGIVYLLSGVSFFFNSFQGITGFVIYEKANSGMGWSLGFAFVIIGIVMLILSLRHGRGELERRAKVRKKLSRAIETGRTGSYRDLKQYARGMGYDVREGKKHTKVYHGDKVVATIPRGSGEIRTGTYRTIMKRLQEEVS